MTAARTAAPGGGDNPLADGSQHALRHLSAEWGTEYHLWVRTYFWARRIGGDGQPEGPYMAAPTPAGLERQLRHAWGEQ
jgi:hypothetical protein